MSRLTQILALGLLSAASVAAQAAPNCASFKSGAYRVINHQETDAAWRHHVLQFNADTLTVSLFDGSSVTLVPQAEKCAYGLPDGGSLVVSRSGVFAVREAGGATMALGLPEMTVAKKALAGVYNYIGAEKWLEDGLFHTTFGQVEIDAKGRVRSASCGEGGIEACGPLGDVFATTAANVDGGYDFTQLDGSPTERLFTFKTKDGTLLAVVGENQIHIAVPALSRTLPAVGALPANWSMSQNPQGLTGGLALEHRKVISVDPVAQSFVRKAAETCVKQTWFVNRGHDGVNFRDKGTGTNCAGQTVNVSAVSALNSGLGFSVFGWESSDLAKARFFGYGIDQP